MHVFEMSFLLEYYWFAVEIVCDSLFSFLIEISQPLLLLRIIFCVQPMDT